MMKLYMWCKIHHAESNKRRTLWKILSSYLSCYMIKVWIYGPFLKNCSFKSCGCLHLFSNWLTSVSYFLHHQVHTSWCKIQRKVAILHCRVLSNVYFARYPSCTPELLLSGVRYTAEFHSAVYFTAQSHYVNQFSMFQIVLKSAKKELSRATFVFAFTAKSSFRGVDTLPNDTPPSHHSTVGISYNISVNIRQKN